MEALSLREREIFESLRELRGVEFAVIGGYAVNAYALPRFSVDCDVVVKDGKVARKIAGILERRGYSEVKNAHDAPYGQAFLRLVKVLPNSFRASFDILIGEVSDRRTGASFSASWIFSHSRVRKLRARSFPEQLDTRIVDADALAAMKLTSSRMADLRDVFMLLPVAGRPEGIRKLVAERVELEEALGRAAKVILSAEFKKNLEGVYGYVEEDAYRRHVEAFRRLVGAAEGR